MNTPKGPKGRKQFLLPWPWNWLLMSAVAVALGFVLNFFWSVIIIITLFLALKKHSTGPTERSYCM